MKTLSQNEIAARFHAMQGMAVTLGQLAMSYFGREEALTISMKGAQDWLTAADGAVETAFRAMIAEAFPQDAVMGEEAGGLAGDCLWIIDPIDGTANFAHAERLWCISIGFVLNGVPELGIIHAPALAETFLARKGHGATLNGKPIRAAKTTDIKKAVIEVGWGAHSPVAGYIKQLTGIFALGASAKRCGSGALGLAHVAVGRTDAYVEAHINAWDVAAGLVICAEAGVVLNDFCTGNWLTEGNAIFAAAPGVAEAVARQLGVPL